VRFLGTFWTLSGNPRGNSDRKRWRSFIRLHEVVHEFTFGSHLCTGRHTVRPQDLDPETTDGVTDSSQ